MKRQADIHRNRKSIAFYCFLTMFVGLAIFSACDVSIPFDWEGCWAPPSPIAGQYKISGSCPDEAGSNEYNIRIYGDCADFTIANLFNSTSGGFVNLVYEFDYSSLNDTLFKLSIAEQSYHDWIISGYGTLRVNNNLKTLTLELNLKSEGQTQTCTITGRKT